MSNCVQGVSELIATARDVPLTQLCFKTLEFEENVLLNRSQKNYDSLVFIFKFFLIPDISKDRQVGAVIVFQEYFKRKKARGQEKLCFVNTYKKVSLAPSPHGEEAS